MPWPPTVPSGTRTNDTAEFDTHAADHNEVHTALTDVVTKIDTTGVPILFNTDVRLRRTASKTLTFDDGTGAGSGASLVLQGDARIVADKNGAGSSVLFTSGFADRTPFALQSHRGTSVLPDTQIGSQIRLSGRRALKTVKTGACVSVVGTADLPVPVWPIGSVRGFTALDVGRSIDHANFPGGTSILSVTDTNNAVASANATASGSATLTVGSVTTDTVTQFELEGNSSLHVAVKDAVGNQAQLNAAFFQSDSSEATSFDALGVGSVARMLGANTVRVAQAYYGEAWRENANSKCFGAELRVTNNAAAGVYSSTAASDVMGLWLTSGGTGDAACGIALGTSGTTTYKVGYAAVAASVADQTFRDDSSSTTSIDINGTHTDGLDTVGATLSGGALRLARAHYIGWRNNANTADLGNGIGVNTSDQLVLGTGSYGVIVMQRSVAWVDGANIVPGTVTGMKICSATTQKLGFWNVTPVVQQAGIINADGTLADITTKFNALIAKMETYGLLAVA